MPSAVGEATFTAQEYVAALDAAGEFSDVWEDVAVLATGSGTWCDVTTSERALRAETHIMTLATAVFALRAETAKLRELLDSRL
jgi:hypothetical protein